MCEEMRKIVIHINKLFYLLLLLLISSCEHDINSTEQQGGGNDSDDKVQIEILLVLIHTIFHRRGLLKMISA